MRIELSPEAEADIQEIARYISLDNPGRAASFAEGIIAACHSLGHSPFVAPIYPGGKSEGLRRKVFKGYLIFYRPKTDVIQIVRILRGARDVRRVLFPSET